MQRSGVDIAVVGAGIIGLTSAVALARAGYRVRVQAAEFTPNTTSDVAAAIWYPFEARPRESVLRWSARTFDVFADEARRKLPGVSMFEMIEVFAEPAADPWWGSAVSSWERCEADDLPRGYVDGYKSAVPLVESSIYLEHLHEELSRLGVSVRPGFVHDFADLNEPCVVNCTGLGSRSLCGDGELYPIRGVVVCTEPLPLKRSLADDEGPNALGYIIPRSGDCVLGGFAQRGEERMTASDDEVADIIARCGNLEPSVAEATIRGVKVGLRPGRSTVRCEIDKTNKRLIHNYGHGGSGFTICWGCAEDVVRFAAESLG